MENGFIILYLPSQNLTTSKRFSTFERRHTAYSQYAKAEDHIPNDFGFGGKPPRRLKLGIVAHRTRLVPLTPPDYRAPESKG